MEGIALLCQLGLDVLADIRHTIERLSEGIYGCHFT